MADKNENTSNDLGNESYSATVEEAAAFDLNPYLVELMWSEPTTSLWPVTSFSISKW